MWTSLGYTRTLPSKTEDRTFQWYKSQWSCSYCCEYIMERWVSRLDVTRFFSSGVVFWKYNTGLGSEWVKTKVTGIIHSCVILWYCPWELITEMWDELYFILCIEQSLLDKTIFKAWLPFWRIFMYVFLFIFCHIFSSNKTLYLSFDQKSVSKNIGNMVDIGDLNHFFFFLYHSQ